MGIAFVSSNEFRGYKRYPRGGEGFTIMMLVRLGSRKVCWQPRAQTYITLAAVHLGMSGRFLQLQGHEYVERRGAGKAVDLRSRQGVALGGEGIAAGNLRH